MLLLQWGCAGGRNSISEQRHLGLSEGKRGERARARPGGRGWDDARERVKETRCMMCHQVS